MLSLADEHCLVAVSQSGDSRILEIFPADSVSSEYSTAGQEITGELSVDSVRAAASTVLDLDASARRTIQRGEIVRLRTTPPRPTPLRTITNLDNAEILRPRIDELITPLLFDAEQNLAVRPFQLEGIEWLQQTPRAILADDMGLGKTAQALLAAQRLLVMGDIRSCVVMCPKSLVLNWAAECAKWTPGLTVIRPMPSATMAPEVWGAILDRAHVIVASYEQLRTSQEALTRQRHSLIIADEAHRLRRSQAQLVHAFRKLDTERLWALTGTPIERHPFDFATLLSLLYPSRFSLRSADDESDLRRAAQPFVLRRRKEEVLGELPSVIEAKEVLELTEAQRKSYSLVQSEPLARNASDILKRLTILRSICDADSGTEASSKLDRIVQILSAIGDAGERAIVFSYTLRPLRLLEARLSTTDPKLKSRMLVGELASEDRNRVVEEFKRDDSIAVLLCSSRVGGEGLTLTEANHVVFLNEWWNPSANDQARDRVVRMGQSRVVQVYRFRCKDTVEESLDEILDQKRSAFLRIVDSLASEVGLMSEHDAGTVAISASEIDGDEAD